MELHPVIVLALLRGVTEFQPAVAPTTLVSGLFWVWLIVVPVRVDAAMRAEP